MSTVRNTNFGGIVTEGLLMNLDSKRRESFVKGGSIWYDMVGDNDFTLYGNTNLTEENNMTFDGTNDYGRNSSIVYDRTKFSIEVWVKYNSNHVAWKSCSFCRWNTGGGSDNEFLFGAQLVSGPTNLQFGIQNSSGNGGNNTNGAYTVSSSFNYVAGTWYQVVGIFDADDNGRQDIYVNGVLEATQETTESQVNTITSSDFSLATFGSYTTYETLCDINVIRMYSGKALDASEVLRNYDALKGRFGLT